MKKTTKFLLVLAAVVAMTIGAVSTVMAADYPVISEWGGSKDKGYTAKDANGKAIVRGWAVSGDSGIYYYFVDGKMATNRFVQTDGKTYYVGSEGAMHTGWIEFTDKMSVSMNGAAYDTVAEAFGKVAIGTAGGEALKDDTRYETVWCYFNGDGSLVKNAWGQVDGIWYYFDGPFCLVDEWSFYVAKEKAYYGFDASGAMLGGWIANTVKGTVNDEAKPYEKVNKDNYNWIYYNGEKSCRLDMKEGWLKDAAGDWYYVEYKTVYNEDKDSYKVPVCITNTILTIDGKSFYLDAAGRMQTTQYTINGGSSSSGKNVNTKVVTTDGVTNGTVNVKKNKSLTMLFKAVTGEMQKGIQGTVYYEKAGDNTIKYAIKSTASGTSINITATKLTEAVKDGGAAIDGQLWTQSFLLVDGSKVYYFDNGEMVKNEAITFGNQILAFGSDGKLITKETSINGVKYTVSSVELDGTGVYFSKVK